MQPLNIFKNGKLKRENNSLAFESKEGEKIHIPVENVDHIKIFAEIDMNKALLAFLSKHEIPVYFFNYYGYLIGTFIPNQQIGTAETLIKQTEAYLDKNKRKDIAIKIVKGAFRNIYRNICYYHSQNKQLEKEKITIKSESENIDRSKTLESLMAHEAAIRREYYKGFNKIVKYDAFKMNGRDKRPPKNYMNALISYGNTMMYLDTLTEIFKTSLDPRIAYLHSAQNRKYSLHLDLAEIFKPVIVDRCIFTMVNRNQIRPEDFRKRNGGIYLHETGKKKFIKEYEQRLEQTLYSEQLKRKATYRGLIKQEAYNLTRYIKGEKDYIPFELRW